MMAHIMGLTFVSAGRVFAMDESGNNFQVSVPINATTPAVSVGDITGRLYVGTSDGNIAFFDHPNRNLPPQLFHVTDQPAFWSLYHAAGTLYLGTGDGSSPGPFELIALDDRSFVRRWQVFTEVL